ncbi:cell division protein [Salmonella enterica]|nr:cell division protein [Salmonella enterica subsp. enterica serovar Rubislaw]EIM6319445.1 cell division protein [Salmonella enterica]EIM8713296.1 cell division protein [Salmonella enterica]
MRVDEIISFFGTAQKAADFYGITREAVYTWRKRPGELIPRGRAAEAAAFSHGKLVFNSNLYPKHKTKKQKRLNNDDHP